MSNGPTTGRTRRPILTPKPFAFAVLNLDTLARNARTQDPFTHRMWNDHVTTHRGWPPILSNDSAVYGQHGPPLNPEGC